MKRFIAIFSVLFFVQFLNVAWCADGDPALMGKTNVGDFTVQSATDSTTGLQVLDADGGTPVLNVDTVNENVGICTTDLDGTPAAGRTVIKGSTNDGTTNIIVGRDSDEANVFEIDTDGNVTATSYTADATSTPSIAFTDSDTTDQDVSAQIYANATATGTGAEVVDMVFQTQGAAGTAGTMQTFMALDASAQNLSVTAGLSFPITTPDLTGNTYTIAAGQYTVLIDDGDADVTGTVVVTLPAAASSTGRTLNIKKIGAAQTVQLDGNGAETIDGAATQDMTSQYDSLTIQCNGTSWFIL